MLTVGQKAPIHIEVLDQNEKVVSLKQLLGKPVVLYFYPKDNTPGCTKEACEFRDFTTELQELGVQVIGVSADSSKSHLGFMQKYELPFPLWSDSEKKLMEAFGVLGEKSMFGKKYIGILRTTFAINELGEIMHVWEKVSPSGHAQEVFNFFTNRKAH